MIDKRKLRKLIEEGLANADRIPRKKHVNLLGSKKRYIKTIVKKLEEFINEE